MVDIKKILTSGVVLVATIAFVGLFIAPIMGITDTNLITLLGVGGFVSINVLHTVLFLPAVEFDFNNRKDPIILVRDSIEQRADDLAFSVELLEKFRILSMIFGMNSQDLENIWFQIYWEPKKALNIKKNSNYDTLLIKEQYPVIYASKLLPKKHFNYSLKVSSTQYTDANDIDIQIKKILKSNGSRIKLFSYLIRINSKNKKILIKN